MKTPPDIVMEDGSSDNSDDEALDDDQSKAGNADSDDLVDDTDVEDNKEMEGIDQDVV